MSGGIVQLVATGVQDAHFTGNPEISFFRSTFKRYTHFAMSNELQIIQGAPSTSGVSTIRFEKKGDLLNYVYLTSKLISSGVNNNPDWGTLISKIEFLIGGQVIDTQDIFFSNTVSPMFINSEFSSRYAPGVAPFFLPLKFFFCDDIQSSIPLVALQYHDVELRITWNNPGTLNEIRAFANYIYLDADERKYIADKPSHDIIMYQVQRVVAQPSTSQDIVFNHPVKFITFPAITYTSPNHTLKLQVNGVDIGIDKPLIHYSQVAPYYHTTMGYDLGSTGYSSSNFNWNTTPMALIPFCLDTSKLQPNGTLNFSRIDSFRLVTNPAAKLGGPTSNIIDVSRTIYIYAVNYNILRISKGMAGLLYSS